MILSAIFRVRASILYPIFDEITYKGCVCKEAKLVFNETRNGINRLQCNSTIVSKPLQCPGWTRIYTLNSCYFKQWSIWRCTHKSNRWIVSIFCWIMDCQIKGNRIAVPVCFTRSHGAAQPSHKKNDASVGLSKCIRHEIRKVKDSTREIGCIVNKVTKSRKYHTRCVFINLKSAFLHVSY